MSISTRAHEQCREILDTKSGVVGFSGDIQQKIRKGVTLSDEDCIRIYVDEKKERANLNAEDIIPSRIGGIQTDVIEIGTIVAHVDRLAQSRPAPRGISCGHVDITAGTLSVCADNTTGDIVDLSNNHVFANSDYDGTRATQGDIILQPGDYDEGNSPADDYAELERWVQLSLTEINYVDCAIAIPINSTDLDLRILDETDSPTLICSGHKTISVGDVVYKSGRTTGYSSGIVEDTSWNGFIAYGIGILYYENQILTTNMSSPGDSGSLVFIPEDATSVKAVGLLFAGGPSGTIHNKIEDVITYLDVNFYVADPTLPYISDITPPAGRDGDAIVISGFRFDSVVVNNDVKIDSTAMTVNTATATELNVTVPTLPSEGIYDITETTGAGTSNAFPFTYLAANSPLIESVSPESGLPGASITITGNGFLATGNHVWFDSTEASITSENTTTIVCEIPSVAAGIRDLKVTHTNGDSNIIKFRVLQPLSAPYIDYITPEEGIIGTYVSIYGHDFHFGIPYNIVKFGTGVATVHTAFSDLITCNVPSLSPGSYEVTVTVDSVTSNSVLFEVISAAPPIPPGPGDGVTIIKTYTDAALRSRLCGGTYHDSYAWYIEGNEFAEGDESEEDGDNATGHLYKVANDALEDIGAMTYRPLTELSDVAYLTIPRQIRDTELFQSDIRVEVKGHAAVMCYRSSDDALFYISQDLTGFHNPDFGYLIGRYSPILASAIRLAAWNNRKIWDILSELAVLVNYELGVTGDGIVFWRKRATTKTILVGDVDDSVTTISCLSTEGFEDFDGKGTIQIDEEVIEWSEKTSNSFTDCDRGERGSIATSHLDGATIYEIHQVLVNIEREKNLKLVKKFPNYDEIFNYIVVPYGTLEMIFDYGMVDETWEDSSEYKYGRRIMRIDNSFLSEDNAYEAEAIAWRYYDHYNQRATLLELETKWQPQLDLGDRLSIKQPVRALLDYAVARIRRIELQMSDFFVRIIALTREKPYRQSIYDSS